MQEFSLFFQDDAGQRGGICPIGKITHQHGEIFQRKCPQPCQHRLLLVGADDLPAVEDGADHSSGAHRLQGGFQRRDAALGGGEHGVVCPGQPAKVEHHRIGGAGLHILQQVGVAGAVELVFFGGRACLFQPGTGGGDGVGLDVKAQHPACRGGDAAEKGGVAAVAAGGIHAQPGAFQPGGKKVLYELYGGLPLPQSRI